MTDVDTRRECDGCDGTGTLASDSLDWSNTDALRAELIALANRGQVDGDTPLDELHTLGRITMIAGRLSWLVSSQAQTQQLRERFNIQPEGGRQVVNDIAAAVAK